MVANIIEDHVVTLVALGEILFCVIDDVVGANGSDQIEIPRAANRRYIRAERLGDLHGKCPNTSGRAVDQNLLPGLNLSLAQALQRSESGERDRSRLLKGDVRRLHGQPSL